MRPFPIRVRLTVWYSVLFATAALLLSLSSWWMLRRTIDATIHQDFEERIDDIRAQLYQFSLQPSTELMQARFDAVYRFRDDGKWLQIRAADGSWVYRSQRMTAADAPLPLPHFLAIGGNTSEFQQGTRYVRTFSSVVTIEGKAYAVELGASLNKQQLLLRQFGIELIILTPLVLFAAVVAGHNMSRKALQPVALIALEARRISDRNLDLRLPVPPTNDEISHLSTTLNNMLARIDAGYRSVRDFTANASHELRTPLARLRTEVEVALLRSRSCEEYTHTLLHVQESAEEMTRLTENLLTLARADADSAPLTLTPVNLGELVRAACAEWSGVADHLRLSIRTGTTAKGSESFDEPAFVLGDRSLLLRLLRILIDNACKFTPAGGNIVVGIEVGQSFVTLSVQDSGIGIAETERQRIFERFYRVNADQDRRRSGSGLGLSLASWIADQHQTAIHVESVLGSGSRFQLTLKRIEDESPATETRKQNEYA
jgi:heavy metal sensor kinase